MLAVLVAVPSATVNSLHPLSTYSITVRHLLDIMEQGKITEADAPTGPSGCHPIWTVGALTSSIPHFFHRMPFLPQPSQFILARVRHRMMLACIPSGLDLLLTGGINFWRLTLVLSVL